MDFPNIIDIATKKVVSIDDTQTIRDAVDLMYKTNHRDVIITSTKQKKFGLIKANDLIKLKLQNIDFNRTLSSIKFDYVNTIHENTKVTEALEDISMSCNCVCIVDDNNNLKGFVSYQDIISSINPNMLLEKRTISELLLSSHLKEANINAKTQDVIGMMDTMIHDSVIITDEEKSVGIITTKDIIALFGDDKDLSLPIKTYMNSPIETIKHTTSIADSIKFIQEKHFKRLIVEDNEGKIVGQISQEELIAKAYSRWADLMKDNDSQLKQVNKILQARATKYEELSTTDALTGIFNRSKFEYELSQEIKRLKRYDVETFSLVLFDIDHFKKINDEHGHLVGDNVLQKLTREIQNSLRTTDVFARWGGEEFVIIMPLTKLENGLKAVEILQSKILSMNCTLVEKVTCSFGITQYKDGDDINSILLRVDNAMYKAKQSGRNCIIVEN